MPEGKHRAENVETEEQFRKANIEQALQLKAQGFSMSRIADLMDIRESEVRALLTTHEPKGEHE